MNEVVDVGMGGISIGEAPTVLTTSSIGSCVAVCLYSHADRVGALAHIMLPTRPVGLTESVTELDYKYADVAFSVMIDSLQKTGISVNQLVTKIVGGANMFPMVQGRSHKIGETNIESVKQLISQYGLKLEAEEVGGSSGRALSFDLTNGIVTIKVII